MFVPKKCHSQTHLLVCLGARPCANPESITTIECMDSGPSPDRLRRPNASRNDNGGGARLYTPILSINRVLPIFAATSRRIGPSFSEVIGASDSAWRASK
jgi:hypothetical protein